MNLEFNNLTYTVVNHRIRGKAKSRDILKSVNGKFFSGQLSAIMGPSGAGKSSLLNALSGYRSAGVTGEFLVGGRPRNDHEFHKLSCYITQDDLLQPLMTVGELMNLAAALKLPSSSSAAFRKSTVDDILRNLGLVDQENTRTEALSGGQKKRLSIALELVNNPPIFFLDEPTSGLDQVTTTHCVKLLRNLAKQGRTVVCTIHQPSASIFEQFDQVYVLAQGLCVYQGGTSALVPFLTSVGLACPRHHNPADFVIEVTESQSNIDTLSNLTQNGKSFQTDEIVKITNIVTNMELQVKKSEVQSPLENVTFQRRNSSTSVISQISNISSTMAWLKMRRLSTDSNIEYATSGFVQFRVLLLRMLLQIRRNTLGIQIQTVHHILCGLLIGLCFYGTANDGVQMFNHLKFCIGVTIFFAYTQIMVPVLVYPQEVKLVKKEYFNRWYGLAPYYAALTVSKLPLQVFLNVIFCSLVYFMAGLPVELFRFLLFCLVGNVVSLAGEGLGLAIGSHFSVTNGCAMGPLAIAPFLGLAIYGFDFAKSIPWMMNLLMKVSFVRCGVVALVLTVFGFGRQPLECDDLYCHFAKPNVLLDYLDISRTSVWFEIGSMVTLMLVFRSLCYLALRRRFAT
ncbi:ATP-binding cassette sub-family G member 1 [Arctopsyche grandis]|uniref:ATP-binding cassette sub-family G member 1 n=1 Tax=Arctopsyche grandis TaxID=121162 RepID=UPI00406DA389